MLTNLTYQEKLHIYTGLEVLSGRKRSKSQKKELDKLKNKISNAMKADYYQIKAEKEKNEKVKIVLAKRVAELEAQVVKLENKRKSKKININKVNMGRIKDLLSSID